MTIKKHHPVSASTISRSRRHRESRLNHAPRSAQPITIPTVLLSYHSRLVPSSLLQYRNSCVIIMSATANGSIIGAWTADELMHGQVGSSSPPASPTRDGADTSPSKKSQSHRFSVRKLGGNAKKPPADPMDWGMPGHLTEDEVAIFVSSLFLFSFEKGGVFLLGSLLQDSLICFVAGRSLYDLFIARGVIVYGRGIRGFCSACLLKYCVDRMFGVQYST